VNWINNVVRPKIRSFLTTKREVPGSNYHMKMSAKARLAHLFDGASFEIVPSPTVAQDPLRFRDGRRYTDRLKDARTKTGLDDAVLIGEGALDGVNVVAAAQDFEFMAGSLGMAAGEAVIAGMLRAVEKKAPFILFSASGGARMQEGILSLMQMPRTTIAVQRLRQAKLPYIVVLTDPTTGGVTASYAMLGDVHIAEPGALICFAGPRVIQQTIREQLPDGFQRSEYLLSHGMIDMVVHRHKMRETLSRICSILMHEGEIGRGAGRSSKVNGGNGKNHLNRGAADGRLIETGTRGTGTAVIEPEPVDEGERFGAHPGDGREKTMIDGPAARSGGKDSSRS
jgi:acetyl-CoA carboxylase carboxyl transferase subunit beta